MPFLPPNQQRQRTVRHRKSAPINSTHYAKLYPQNGDRIVTIDFDINSPLCTGTDCMDVMVGCPSILSLLFNCSSGMWRICCWVPRGQEILMDSREHSATIAGSVVLTAELTRLKIELLSDEFGGIYRVFFAVEYHCNILRSVALFTCKLQRQFQGTSFIL